MSVDDPIKTFSELVLALRQRQVVPFVGAGLSLGCRDPNHPKWAPTVETMRDQLVKLLRSASEPPTRIAPLLPEAKKRPLAEVAEITLLSGIGATDLSAVVGPSHLVNLSTGLAHRCIARLAREGFIEEAITTNFDTCLERAFNATFRHERSITVVATEDDAQRPRAAPVGERFAVYKINGCAERYLSNPKHHDLLVADSQLLEMQHGWRPDLLRERLRSRRVVFTGFGGEESQVRIVVRQVIAANRSDDSRSKPSLATNRAGSNNLNHPIVLEFKNHISTFQNQLIGKNGSYLSGAHKYIFREASSGLDGGTVWNAAYTAAVADELIDQLLRPKSATRNALAAAGLGHTGGARAHRTVKWLRHCDAGTVIRSLGGTELLSEPFPQPTQPPTSEGSPAAAPPVDAVPPQRTITLQRLFAAARGIHDANPPPHVPKTDWERYTPLREHPADLTLLVVALVDGLGTDVATPEQRAALNVGLLPQPGSHPHHRLFEVALWSEAANARRRELHLPPEGGDLRLTGAVAWPERTTTEPLRVRCIRHPAIGEKHRQISVVEVPVRKLSQHPGARAMSVRSPRRLAGLELTPLSPSNHHVS